MADRALPPGLNDPNSPLSRRVIYFDYDNSNIKPEFVEVLRAHARYIATTPKAKVMLEGHTDARGTREHNLALAEASLGSGDLVVSGPGGYSQAAAFVQMRGAGGAARTITVTYSVGAPGGAWGPEDAGSYTFRLAVGTVADRAGNVAPARTLTTLGIAYERRVYLPVAARGGGRP